MFFEEISLRQICSLWPPGRLACFSWSKWDNISNSNILPIIFLSIKIPVSAAPRHQCRWQWHRVSVQTSTMMQKSYDHPETARNTFIFIFMWVNTWLQGEKVQRQTMLEADEDEALDVWGKYSTEPTLEFYFCHTVPTIPFFLNIFHHLCLTWQSF